METCSVFRLHEGGLPTQPTLRQLNTRNRSIVGIVQLPDIAVGENRPTDKTSELEDGVS
jgi:hypothetical protein